MMFPTACRRTRNGHLVARVPVPVNFTTPVRHRYPAGVGGPHFSHALAVLLGTMVNVAPGKAGGRECPLFAGLCKGVSIDLRIDGCRAFISQNDAVLARLRRRAPAQPRRHAGSYPPWWP